MIELLHILSDSNIGGAGKALLSFLDGFDTTGFCVRVAIPRGSAVESLVRAYSADVIELPCGGDRSLAPDFLAASSALIRKVRPTILHTHAGLAAQVAGFYHRVPVRVATKHRVEEHTGILRRLSLPNAGIRWIAVSEAVAQGLRGAGVPKNWVFTVPNGVTVEDTPKAVDLRAELGIGVADPVYGIVGRCEAEKGIDCFLTAARIVREAVPSAHFLIVGAGSCLPALRKIRDAGVHVLGYRADMSAVYATLDVLVNASLTEAASMSLLEGMAAGLPVIATAVGGTPELLGESGYLFAPQDAGALAQAMLMLADPVLRRRMGTQSRLRIRERYQSRITAELLRELYLDFCGETPYSRLRRRPHFYE